MKTIQKGNELKILWKSNDTVSLQLNWNICLKPTIYLSLFFVFLIWKYNNFILKWGHNSSQLFFSFNEKCNYVPDLMIYFLWSLLYD